MTALRNELIAVVGYALADGMLDGFDNVHLENRSDAEENLQRDICAINQAIP